MAGTRTPDLTALRMLCSVQERSSLSAAGAALGLSQQAVSLRMRALESQLGTSLIARSARGSTLTPTGTLVAGWAREILEAADRLDAGIAALRRENTGTLRVVASQTIAEHLLPGWLVALRRRQLLRSAPSSVTLQVTNSAAAAELVRAGQFDLGFVETPLLPAGLRTRTVSHDDLVVVVAPGHRWPRRRKPLGAAELAATPLVTREMGSGTRAALPVLLAGRLAATAPAAPAVELSTSAAVRSAIAAGTAPGVLSALAVRDDVALGRLIIVATDFPLRRPLTAIWPSGRLPHFGPARDLLEIATAEPDPVVPTADPGARQAAGRRPD